MTDLITKNESALLVQDELSYYQTEYTIDSTKENKNLQAFCEKCKVYDLKSFMELELQHPATLLAPIIAEGSLSMLHAYRGIGKSFFAMSLALAVANGSKFLRWNAPRPAKVLYVDGEMSAFTLQERFTKLSGCPLFVEEQADYTKNLVLFAADMQPFPTINIGEKEVQYGIEQMIENNGIKLVILDNISSLTTIDELDSTAWLPIQEWLISLRKKNIAVLLIHHSGKNGGQRGVSKREDILDLVISLRDTTKKPQNNRTTSNQQNKSEDEEEDDCFGGKCQVTFEKNRNIGGKNKLTNFGIQLLDMDNGSIMWTDIYAAVKQLYEDGLSGYKIAALTGISKTRVYEILKQE